MDTMPNGKLLPRFSGQGNPQPHVGVSTHVFSPFLPPTVVSWFAWSDFERGEMEIVQASKRKPRQCNFTPLSQAESHWGFTQPRASKNARTYAESFSWLSLIKMHEVRGRVTSFASFPVRQIRHNRGRWERWRFECNIWLAMQLLH